MRLLSGLLSAWRSVRRRNPLGRRQRPERHRRRQPEQHQLGSARQRLLRAAGRAAPERLPHDRLDRRRGSVEPDRLRDPPAQSAAGHDRQPRADQPGGVCAPVHGHPLPVVDGEQLQQHHLRLVLWLQGQHRAAAAMLACLLVRCPDASSNSYAFSELPFPEAHPNTAPTNSFLAMMLTASNLAGADLILSRGVASDSTFPTQTVYLAKTSDAARNVRFVEFDNAVFASRVRGDNSLVWTNTDSTSFHQPARPADGLAAALAAGQRLCRRARWATASPPMVASSLTRARPDHPAGLPRRGRCRQLRDRRRAVQLAAEVPRPARLLLPEPRLLPRRSLLSEPPKPLPGPLGRRAALGAVCPPGNRGLEFADQRHRAQRPSLGST